MLVGVVGKPNVGKSTFFKALTLIEVAAANYPFTTIEPNRGFAFVRIDCVDKELGVQCNPGNGYCINHQRFVPVEMIDVAGLVPGAHEGKGLGNKFLDDLRQADVLIHVIDASGSTNEGGEMVERGSYDPLNDVSFLEEEVGLWFFGVIKGIWQKLARQAMPEVSKRLSAMAENLSGLGVSPIFIERTLREMNLIEKDFRLYTNDEIKMFAFKLRELAKPIVIAANKCDLPTAEKNIGRLKEAFPHLLIVPCSAESEYGLKKAAKANLIEYIPGDRDFKDSDKLNEAQKNALNSIRENVMKKFNGTGVQTTLNKAVFDVLHFKAIFPGGVNNLVDSAGRTLPDCFLMPPQATALDFAYKLHTTMGDNFIKAIDVKTKRLIGKDHILNHRDVVEIAFNKNG